MEVRFHDVVDDELISFAVIVASHCGRWVLCRHRERGTFEVPGGRREPGEPIEETARRELFEETGALAYTLSPICAYSVTGATRANAAGSERFGMLYAAEIGEFGRLPECEIAEVRLFDALPRELTYPLIQPALVERVRAATASRP